MSHPLPALVLAALAALGAIAASAQTAPQAAPSAFRSALDGYQPFADEQLAPWKESNDNVGRIGGWRAYAKEAGEARPGSPAAPAAEPAAPAAAPARPAAPPAHPGAGHGKQ